MEKVQLVPAKRFFVEMLTRDIELADAILDLIDNCLDGAMRILNGDNSGLTPYKDFEVDISFDEEHFRISDNCGGIPKEVALQSAFRMGRHDSERDKDLPTVGVYGIGMKRAIFKMGEDTSVGCNTENGCYRVDISKDWMMDDTLWELPLIDLEDCGEIFGTTIEVKQLRDGIKQQFINQDFIDELFKIISTHFSYIIAKGLSIKVNGECVTPDISITRFAKDFSNKKDSIAPYVYKNNMDGVDVEVTIGFYRSLGTDEEEQDEKDGKSVSSRAGITLICNDRVVLHNDKSHITGWGEAGVPSYHTQFIGISGVVIFQSNNPAKLPLKTTKRGVDSSSMIYAVVKDKIREGLKIFTDFTNKWKKSSKGELSKHFKVDETESAPSITLSQKVKAEEWSNVRRDGGQVFKPRLPLPKETDPTERIVFTKKKSEIRAVSEYLFDEVRPTTFVGEYCFDQILKKV
ncbi:ATP-binding protein [Vibrio fluvialis]|nr:ATP-binding protein [Vibrio fluvialis]